MPKKAPPSSPLPADVARWRAQAYRGPLGAERAAFCQDYTEHKQKEIAELSRLLKQKVEAENKSISCGLGCDPCCHVYVVASLAECEAIVHYLYRHEETLRLFLRNYARWRAAAEPVMADIFEVSHLRQKQMDGQADAADQGALDAALAAYASLYLPCLFLQKGACSIYEVRPYVCAALAATSPRECCIPGHPRRREVRLLKAEVNLDEDMPYFANPAAKVGLTCLPPLVNEILTRGWDFLGSVPGCERLREAVR
jgi:Fe-S-cluster containining protein